MKKLLFFLPLLLNFNLQEQDFEALAQNISDQLQTVASGKKEYQQSLEVQEPGVVLIKTDSVLQGR